MIAPNTIISTINLDSIPESKDKFELPGASAPNSVSYNQLRTIVTYIQEIYPATLTFADAVARLRERFVKGNQRDFNIVNGIIDDLRTQNADNDLTQNQQDLVNTILGSLAGTSEHWDKGIAARIAAAPKSLRNQFTVQFSSCFNQGQLNILMNRFAQVFGKPTPKAGFGDSVFDTSPLTALDVQTSLQEPF